MTTTIVIIYLVISVFVSSYCGSVLGNGGATTDEYRTSLFIMSFLAGFLWPAAVLIYVVALNRKVK